MVRCLSCVWLRQKRRTCTLKTFGCSMLLRCPASGMIARLGAGNGGVELLCDVHRAATIHVAPQQQRGHLNPREEISGVRIGG